MKLPRFTVRDLVMLVAIAALALGWWGERRRAERLAVELSAREIEQANRDMEELMGALRRPGKNPVGVDAETQARESADPR